MGSFAYLCGVLRYSTICMRHLLRGDMEIVLSSRSGSLSDSFAELENTSEEEGEMGARNCGVASSAYRSGTLRPCSQFKLVKLLSGELLFLPPRCFCCRSVDGLQLKLSMLVTCAGSATVTKTAPALLAAVDLFEAALHAPYGWSS